MAIMEWHDCKTDPPKKSGWYLLCFIAPWKEKMWNKVFYNKKYKTWENFNDFAYKWIKVDLSEV